MIIDATNLIAGRLATFVAKKALLGEEIEIVNSEKAVLTGKKSDLMTCNYVYHDNIRTITKDEDNTNRCS